MVSTISKKPINHFLPTALGFVLLSLTIASCSEPEEKTNITRSFYFWRTTFALSAEERAGLKSMHIQKLYVRFFDIDWDDVTAQTMPKGKITFRDSLPSAEIVPVVYITNKTFLRTPLSETSLLATRAGNMAKQIALQNNIAFKELQIDCDWSDETREKYFSFLTHLRKLFPEPLILSVTLRLHQIKYRQRTGIPPADRGMLMFYNMGTLEAYSERNSIFNEKDAAKYIRYTGSYPMALDVALPVFHWTIQVRDNKIIALWGKESFEDAGRDTCFASQGNNCFLATRSFYRQGRYIRKGDLLRKEDISEEELKEAAAMISREVKAGKKSIVLFDLDSKNLSHYEKEVLEEAFDHFD